MRFAMAVILAGLCVACNDGRQQTGSWDEHQTATYRQDPHVCVDSRTNKVVPPSECDQSYGNRDNHWFMWYMIGRAAAGDNYHYPAYGSYLSPQSPWVRSSHSASNFAPTARKTIRQRDLYRQGYTAPGSIMNQPAKPWAKSSAARPTSTPPKSGYKASPPPPSRPASRPSYSRPSTPTYRSPSTGSYRRR